MFDTVSLKDYDCQGLFMSAKQKPDFYERFMAEANGRRARALKLHAAGKTYAEIGSELGVSKQRAFDLVQRAKLDASGGLPSS